jgi:uncharacterized protein YkwD
MRTRPWLVIVVALLGFGAPACVWFEEERVGPPVDDAPRPDQPPADDPDATPGLRMARTIFDRVADEREARDLGDLEWDDALAEVAREWSADMARRAELEHQDLPELIHDPRLGHFVGLGENIFQATGPVPAGVIHAGWMRSDGHRRNVLQPGFDRIGIAVVCTAAGETWSTQLFGRTGGALPQLSDESPPLDPFVRPEGDGPSC